MQKRSALYECVMDGGKQSEKSRFSNTQIWGCFKAQICWYYLIVENS